MSLNLTIINCFGVWQCSDHRLTVGNRVEDDTSNKHVAITCPNGAALIAYAGAGALPSGGRWVHVSDWMRATLRGEPSRPVAQYLRLLCDNATRDLASHLYRRPAPIRHMFSIGAFERGVPWAVQIRNFDVTLAVPLGPVLNHFVIARKQIGTSGFVSTFGTPAVSSRDWRTLCTIAGRNPRRPQDFSDLLASINKRAAASKAGKGLISPHCETSYLPPSGIDIKSHEHGENGLPVAPSAPFLLNGLDLTEFTRIHLARFNEFRKPGGVWIEDKAADDRAGRNATVPSNPLKP